MPDFESIPTPELTAAEQAVIHILRRVANDRDFSWVMLHTESLRKCLTAEALRSGQTEDEVEADLHKAMAANEERLKRSNADRPEVLILREKVEALERGASKEGEPPEPPPVRLAPRTLIMPEVLDSLREMYDSGKVLYAEYQQMVACLS